MGFADVGQTTSWILFAAWVTAVGVVALSARLGWSRFDAVLPTGNRVSVTIGTGLAVTLSALQSTLVDTIEDTTGVGLLDGSVLRWFIVQRSDPATTVMRGVSAIGGTAAMTALAVLGAAELCRRSRRVEAGVVVVATAGAGLLVPGLKNLYDRARPPVADRLGTESNPALPSGHALGSLVVLGVLAAVVVLVSQRFAVQVAAVAGAGVATLVIGVSRLYLGMHWLTDVLAGWAIGGAWLSLCVTVLVLVTRGGRVSGSRAFSRGRRGIAPRGPRAARWPS